MYVHMYVNLWICWLCKSKLEVISQFDWSAEFDEMGGVEKRRIAQFTAKISIQWRVFPGRMNLVDQACTLIVEISFMLEERFAFSKTNTFRGISTSVENNSGKSQWIKKRTVLGNRETNSVSAQVEHESWYEHLIGTKQEYLKASKTTRIRGF